MMLDKPIYKTRQASKKDDLTRIKGIAVSVQEKFNQAGILTFSDIAMSTPEILAAILADLIGFSAKRIERENWIGQAKQLATLTDQENKQPDGTYKTRQSYAVFNVQLLLDAEKNVRRTQVTEVRTQKKSIWAGWDADKLNAFIRQSADLNFASGAKSSPSPISHAVPTSEMQDITDKVPADENVVLTLEGDLRIKSLNFLDENEKGINALSLMEQPLKIHLLLDLSDVSLNGTEKLIIESYIYARELGTTNRKLLANSQKAVKIAKQINLDVKGDALPPGEYRLDVVVIIRPGVRGSQRTMQLMCLSEGKLLKVRQH